MTAPWHRGRRRHGPVDPAQRFARPDLPAAPVGPAPAAWWRSEHGDHAFGGGSTMYMRSACGAVRWTVLMQPVDGIVHPCAGCLAVVDPRTVAPLTPLEALAMDGDR